MIMKINSFFAVIFFLGFSMLLACSHEVIIEDIKEVPEVVTEAPVPITFEVGMSTKVANNTFEVGDRAGIYMVSYSEGAQGTMVNSGNTYDNVGLQLTNNGWVPSVNMYWPDKTNKADFYAYYPYGTPDNVRAYSFSVRSNQNSASYYYTSDFLWGCSLGVPPSESFVSINTKHLMSSVNITLKPGAGFTADVFAKLTKTVTISNIKTLALVDLESGSVSASGTQSAIVPYDTGDVFKAVIVPQSVTSANPFITISMNNENYVFKTDVTFKSGLMYNFTITVNRTGAGINLGITDWESDGETHNGTAE